MRGTELESFVRAQQTAQEWLSAIAKQLGVRDQEYAYRLLRAWLHTVRDRLPVGQVVQLAAELPELLRGIYYEGWEPADAPHRVDVDDYTNRFARQARVSTAEVRHGAVAVTVALRSLVTPGQLDQIIMHLCRPIRELLDPVTIFRGRKQVLRVPPAQELAHAGHVTPRPSL